MKRLLIIGLLLLSCSTMGQRVVDSAWRSDVHTVELYAEGGITVGMGATSLGERFMPVLDMSNRGRLVLEFDVLRSEPEHLHWVLRHCDAEWHPDDMEPQEFMTGFEYGTIDNYDFSFTTLTDYVHYRATAPDRYAEFTHSGNYALYVVVDDDGDTLLSRRFAVSEQAVHIDATVGRPYDGMELMRRQEVDVCVDSRTTALTTQYLRVVAQQNGRLDTRRQLEFAGYDGGTLCFRHRAANVFEGGNTFRFFDLSNLRSPMYNVLRVEEYGGEQMAMVRPCDDRSRNPYVAETVLRGGMKVNIWDRQNPRLEADYVWVNLSLPVAQPLLEGEVHVVGALTDWRLDEGSRMDYDPRRRAYTKRLLLKQGYYAYQLLVRPMRSHEGETGRLEGNHQETSNVYTVYVYQHSPADRADRLLGMTMVER